MTDKMTTYRLAAVKGLSFIVEKAVTPKLFFLSIVILYVFTPFLARCLVLSFA